MTSSRLYDGLFVIAPVEVNNVFNAV